MKKFDYESKIWGANVIKPSPFYIQGLKLQYVLNDLVKIHGRVLDMGCGAGNMAKAIKKYRPDLKVWGVDISKKAIEAARILPAQVRFDVGDVCKLPYKDRYFDAVVMFDVLEHLERPSDALKEVGRVLKPDGVFHVFSPLDGQAWTLYKLIEKAGWQPKNKHTGHLHVFSDKDFEFLLKKNGFTVDQKHFSFHWFFSLFDISYFSLLEIFRLKAPSSIEGIIIEKKQSIFFKIFNLFYRLVILVGYLESLVFSKIPGGGGHYLVKKA